MARIDEDRLIGLLSEADRSRMGIMISDDPRYTWSHDDPEVQYAIDEGYIEKYTDLYNGAKYEITGGGQRKLDDLTSRKSYRGNPRTAVRQLALARAKEIIGSTQAEDDDLSAKLQLAQSPEDAKILLLDYQDYMEQFEEFAERIDTFSVARNTIETAFNSMIVSPWIHGNQNPYGDAAKEKLEQLNRIYADIRRTLNEIYDNVASFYATEKKAVEKRIEVLEDYIEENE